MPRKTFDYHPDATTEASEAFQWYAERSDRAAKSFWQELRKARQCATRQPDSWPKYLHGTRCYKLNRFPFVLVYIERGEKIIGIAEAHLKRGPGYWRKRLKD
jgi:hypothetical protein